MQTFLPYPDFAASAAVLDNRRLGNQCYREALTLYRGGWPNHPAARMWRGHPRHLALYGLACAGEMRRRTERGEANWRPGVLARWVEFWEDAVMARPPRPAPWWLADPRLHTTHRAVLTYKDPAHYGAAGWGIKPKQGAPGPDGKLPYWWPV